MKAWCADVAAPKTNGNTAMSIEMLSAYPSMSSVVSSVLEAWPEHLAYCTARFRDNDPGFLDRTEEFATLVVKSTGDDLPGYCKDYRWMCEEFLNEEVFFRRHGHYRLSTFGEANAEIYSNHAYMSRYVRRILISQIIWDPHARAFDLFRTELLGKMPADAHYVEVGPGHGFFLSALDYVLLAFDHRWLSLDALCIDPGSTEQRLAEACATIGAVVETITQNNGATVIVPTMPVPAGGLFGSFDRRVPGTPRAMVDRVNRSIVVDSTERNAPLLDAAELAGAVGCSAWFDDRLYHLYKIPFALDFVPIYCDYVCRLLAGLRGRARKCLVLDLDNSIWGGAIGDDGIDGIVLGTGNAAGEAYLAVQRTAVELKTRGIILAVCSKNDDAVAREPFRSHPDMILREADIAVFQANWSDKASNIEAIAKTLDIGLDFSCFSTIIRSSAQPCAWHYLWSLSPNCPPIRRATRASSSRLVISKPLPFPTRTGAEARAMRPMPSAPKSCIKRATSVNI